MKTLIYIAIAIFICCSVNTINAEIIKVPSDFQTIELAVANAQAGDTIILAPGTYNEKLMTISKPLTVSSEWILTGDEAKIESTVVNASGSKLFSIWSNDVEISGLKIINGDHTLDIHARVSVKHNIMINNSDGVSMESEGGGYVGFNLIENNSKGDDCIDLDINQSGSDIIIEYNELFNSVDDGIEIRLFTAPNQNINYEIRHNTITGSGKAGIQLISYDVYTGKVFNIHHNIFRNCKTGLGCMDGSNTSEDLSGALFMDEKVYFYNNTILENEMGATGGNNIVAINNIVAGNTIGGFKRFGENSVIVNNLLFNNKDNNFIEIHDSVEQYDNLVTKAPLLNETNLSPGTNSPCIDAGLDKFILDGITVIEIKSEEYLGTAPDIGAIESDGENGTVSVREISEKSLISNFPNPFKESTSISINLLQTGYIKVDIYDMKGRNIDTLEDGLIEKGMHTIDWSARDNNGNRLPGGIYIARVHSGNSVRNTKMLLLK
ncbi:FlgD immunoglobulin-like domain containing protein [Bacteroidota bacterium]